MRPVTRTSLIALATLVSCFLAACSPYQSTVSIASFSDRPPTSPLEPGRYCAVSEDGEVGSECGEVSWIAEDRLIRTSGEEDDVELYAVVQLSGLYYMAELPIGDDGDGYALNPVAIAETSFALLPALGFSDFENMLTELEEVVQDSVSLEGTNEQMSDLDNAPPTRDRDIILSGSASSIRIALTEATHRAVLVMTEDDFANMSVMVKIADDGSGEGTGYLARRNRLIAQVREQALTE